MDFHRQRALHRPLYRRTHNDGEWDGLLDGVFQDGFRWICERNSNATLVPFQAQLKSDRWKELFEPVAESQNGVTDAQDWNLNTGSMTIELSRCPPREVYTEVRYKTIK